MCFSDEYRCNMMAINKATPFYYSQSGDAGEDKKLLEPVEYMLQRLGKHVFTKLTPAFNYWFKISFDRLQQINEIVDVAYTVCILFDDIQDNSILREGFPVAHSVYGLCNTINAANYVKLIAFEKIANLHPAAMTIFIEHLMEFNRGQGMDMYWKDNFTCPTEEEYRIMAIRKSSWLVKLAIKLMKLFSNYEEDFSSLMDVMGLYYQIRNDYSNLCLGEYNDNKDYCDDITEGKFSFPIIHALTNNADDRQIINILKQRTTNVEVKRYCIQLLETFGSFKYTRDVLEELDKKIRIEIERLGGNPLLVKILDEYKNKVSKDPLTEKNLEMKEYSKLGLFVYFLVVILFFVVIF